MKCIWNGGCLLGEGPLWMPNENALYWVDILKNTLHRLMLENNQHDFFTFSSEVCSVVPCLTGGFLIALRAEIIFFDPAKNQKRQIVALDSKVEMFNDGHCDAQGRFWIGTKDVLEKNPIGHIYALDKKQFHQYDNHFTVTNGFVFSVDHQYFYMADSPARIIYRYQFDLETGILSDRKIFAKIPDDAGYPDGMAIDAEGYLWNCHFNGWRITRYTPAGEVDRVIEVPTQAPTSCCFGGKDFKTLFITSAKRDVINLHEQPMAGAVFAVSVDTPGLPACSFSGDL